ncbi:hypothetical protein [Leptolyngbya sp. NIES-2104]|uniref:hypothetical protein n=1 Tax=Leptolyngbya sp. NIES-2104 TaxID=1552121 RepID=UPI0006EC6784|nr:hypothetical protein [Leptolyngbya sp. NIES-2104]GAP99543.1 hypothetical protein NIES2104_61090 [Leptolyngbya sp. NIES-2104]
MDFATLTAFLSPFLPQLLDLGTKTAAGAATKVGETAGTKLTENAFNKAKALWEKLFPKVAVKASAQEAVQDVANNPDDPDFQSVLRVQLKKILEADAALAEVVFQILEEKAPDGTSGVQIVQTVVGNQNQMIGQMTGGKLLGNVTGDVNL